MKNKIKGIILIMLLTFIFSGCTADYKLEITESGITESLTIGEITDKNALDDFMSTNLGYHFYDNYNAYSKIRSDKKIYYKKDMISEDTVRIYYNPNIDLLSNSAIIKNCFNGFQVREGDTDYKVITDPGFLCLDKFGEIDSVNIKIIIDSAAESNANFIDGANHYWTVNSNNYENFYIDFKFPIEFSPIEEKFPEEIEEGGSEEIDGASSQNNPAPDYNSSIYDEDDEDGDDKNSDDKNSDDKSSIRENDDQEADIKNKEKNNTIIILVIVIGIITIFGVVFIIKKNKNNKI